MKSFKTLLLVLNLLCISQVSCKKFLDEKQDTALTVPQTLSDAQALLDLPSITQISKGTSSEFSSDNVNFPDELFTGGGGGGESFSSFFQLYTWGPDLVSYDGAITYVEWKALYQAVYYANNALEVLDRNSRNASNATAFDNIKGSALFIRAYYFFSLATTFAKAYNESTADQDLGIPLRLNSDFNQPSVRSSLKATYEQILEDANACISLLPNQQSISTRPSKAAAYGLLAQIYLAMRKYDEAGKYANLSLNIKNDLLDYNLISTSSDTPIQRFNVEISFYVENGNAYAFLYYPIQTSFYQSFASNDLRAKINFSYNASLNGYQAKGSYAGNPYRMFTGIATDEIYLMRAECFARAGKVAEAMADLNKLAEKRYDKTFSPFIASDAETALNIILEERRKELFFRGVRWMDLKRLNMEGRNIVITKTAAGKIYTLEPNSGQYSIPIPKKVIDLTEMPQN